MARTHRPCRTVGATCETEPVKPAAFAYRRPEALDDALTALAGDKDAKVLAGGQSLVPLLNMRLAAPSTLVDINRLPGLDEITVDSDGVRIGALVRHSALLAHDEAAKVQPLVGKALQHVAHPTIRNRGTSVGSLVHADAAAELPAVLALLGGSVEVASTRGTRTIGAADLYVGPLETSLSHDEIATSAYFPALPAGASVAFAEISRRHGDYALAGAAAVVRREGDVVREVKVAYLSVCEVPTVVDVTGLTAKEAGERALEHLDPLDDIHASAAYRAQLVRVLTARVLREPGGE